MRAIAVIGLAAISAGVSPPFSIPTAKSQSLDDMARCQSIEDTQRRAACLNGGQKPLSRTLPLPRPRPQDASTARMESVRRTVSRRTEAFEGLWAQTKDECLDEESPTSKTLIDLNNLEDGKPAPLFDRYEHHCRIEDRANAGGDTSLTATCFEFWDDFLKGTDGIKTSIKLSLKRDGTLVIDGKKFQRCEPKSP
jgi:hypothetical protein